MQTGQTGERIGAASGVPAAEGVRVETAQKRKQVAGVAALVVASENWSDNPLALYAGREAEESSSSGESATGAPDGAEQKALTPSEAPTDYKRVRFAEPVSAVAEFASGEGEAAVEEGIEERSRIPLHAVCGTLFAIFLAAGAVGVAGLTQGFIPKDLAIGLTAAGFGSAAITVPVWALMARRSA